MEQEPRWLEFVAASYEVKRQHELNEFEFKSGVNLRGPYLGLRDTNCTNPLPLRLSLVTFNERSNFHHLRSSPWFIFRRRGQKMKWRGRWDAEDHDGDWPVVAWAEGNEPMNGGDVDEDFWQMVVPEVMEFGKEGRHV